MNNNIIETGQQQQSQSQTNMMFTISDANSTANVSYSRGASMPPYHPNIFTDNISVFDMNQSTIHTPSYHDAPNFM